jgi:hypothetical protein
MPALLDPRTRLVISPRGYGRTSIINALPQANITSAVRLTEKPVYHSFDIGPRDDLDLGLRLAAAMDEVFRDAAPWIQVRVFARTEQWLPIRNSQRHHWLNAHSIHYYRPAPLKSYEDRNLAMACSDSFGVVLPHVYASATECGVEAAAFTWCLQQPEAKWLSAALPPEASVTRRIPITSAVKKLRAAQERGYGFNGMGPRQFIDHCQVIGALRRNLASSVKWSRLWYTGCLRMVQED